MTRFICLTCCSCFQNSFRIPLTFDLFRLRNGNINDNRYVTFIDSFSSNGTTCWLSMILQYFLLLLLLLYGHMSSFYKHIVCTCAFWVLLHFCTHWHKLFDTCTYGIYSNAQSSVFSASNKIRIKEIYTQTITRTQIHHTIPKPIIKFTTSSIYIYISFWNMRTIATITYSTSNY